jgi:hypothetical protein
MQRICSWTGIAMVFGLTLMPLASRAQFESYGSQDLTPQVVDSFIKATEYLYLGKMNESQRARVRVVLERQWNDGSTAANVVQTIEGHQKLLALPARTQRLALMSNLMGSLISHQESASQGDDYSKAVLEAYSKANPPLNPQAPLFSKVLADAYVDAFLFMGAVRSGKAEPKVGEESRQKLRLELARDFAKADRQSRDQFQKAVGVVIGHMLHWPTMNELDRLMVKADLGARLAPHEQQAVMQARQMMNNHSMQMMSNQLGWMRQNTDTIMGSAPRWNPSSNRWEQKGGIITEFGVSPG